MIPPATNFKWLGPEVECSVPSLKSPIHKFYDSFWYNDEVYSEGDFVIIKLPHGTKVGRLSCMYESLQNYPKYFGVITWFTKALYLPRAITRNIVYDEKELVEDLRNTNIFILLEDIVSKCCVVFGTVNDSINLIKNMQLNEDEEEFYFSCRYKLQKNKLRPILNIEETSLVGEDDLSLNDFTPEIKNSIKKIQNYYKNSPLKSTSLTPSKVKRNLNESFDSQHEALNYSIVSEGEVEHKKDLKIKLRLSTKNSSTPTKKLTTKISPKKNKKGNLCVDNKNSPGNVKVVLKTFDDDYVLSIPKDLVNEKEMRKLRKSVVFVEGPENDITKTRSGRASRKSYVEDFSYDDFDSDEGSIKSPKKRTRSRSTSTNMESPSKNKKMTAAPQSVSRRRTIKSVETSEATEQLELLCLSPCKRTRSILKDETRSTPKKNVTINDKNEEAVTRTPSTRKKLLKEIIESPQTPRKIQEAPLTPSKKTKVDISPKNTPQKRKNVDEDYSTPKKNAPPKTPKTTPGARMKLIRQGVITPSMHSRKSMVVAEGTPLHEARAKLHVSYVPKALPCRENEFQDVLNFVQGKLWDGLGGCMYISGVPGTGKTATVTEVVRTLQKQADTGEIPNFTFVGINGMKLTEPRQAYVEILKQLTGKTVPWEQAHTTLETRFTKKSGTKKSEPIVLLVDELDILCTKRQDVVYNLLDWPTKASGQLIVITIANTMDLPERLLMGRVTSRLGLTRLTFQAYTFKQLQEIVMKRLVGTNIFNPDAVQLVARKVASVSGDARRALDICRKSAEVAELEGPNTLVSMSHVNEALNTMITQPKVRAIKHCSRLEQLILQSVVAEVERTGVDETNFHDVFRMLSSVAGIDGFQMVSASVALAAVSRLSSCRLLLADQKTNDLHQKLILNVSPDDIFYALKKD